MAYKRATAVLGAEGEGSRRPLERIPKRHAPHGAHPDLDVSQHTGKPKPEATADEQGDFERRSMSQREYGKYVPRYQVFAQGQTGNRNAINRQIRQTRQIEPGNNFNKRVRIGLLPIGT